MQCRAHIFIGGAKLRVKMRNTIANFFCSTSMYNVTLSSARTYKLCLFIHLQKKLATAQRYSHFLLSFIRPQYSSFRMAVGWRYVCFWPRVLLVRSHLHARTESLVTDDASIIPDLLCCPIGERLDNVDTLWVVKRLCRLDRESIADDCETGRLLLTRGVGL
jgi:hypothetical protein